MGRIYWWRVYYRYIYIEIHREQLDDEVRTICWPYIGTLG